MESVLRGNCFSESKWVREYIGIIQFCMHGFELLLCCIPQRRTCLFNRGHPVALLKQYVKLMLYYSNNYCFHNCYTFKP
jgi:hypothetical protein